MAKTTKSKRSQNQINKRWPVEEYPYANEILHRLCDDLEAMGMTVGSVSTQTDAEDTVIEAHSLCAVNDVFFEVTIRNIG